jgi:predicted chitinase
MNTKLLKEIYEISRKMNIVEAKGIFGLTPIKWGRGPESHTKGHPNANWKSNNAWDLGAPAGNAVYSLTSGVASVRQGSPELKLKNNARIYGDSVTIKSTNGPDVFYTHIETSLLDGQQVNVGDFIGTIVAAPPQINFDHCHLGLSSGDIKDLVNEKGEFIPNDFRNTLSSLVTGIFVPQKLGVDFSKTWVESFFNTLSSSQTPTNFSTGLITHGYSGKEKENISTIINILNSKGVTNPYTQIGVLSVIGNETGFINQEESSYENTPNSRIRGLFSKTDGISDSELTSLKQNPEKFFNFIYKGINGNEQEGDGYKYRGRGFNQLTGRGNYKFFGQQTGYDLEGNPELLNDDKVALEVMVKFLLGNTPPEFTNKEDATIYFAKKNTGRSSGFSKQLAMANKFDVNQPV